MTSGIKCPEEVKATYNGMKSKKKSTEKEALKYIIYKFNDKFTGIIEDTRQKRVDMDTEQNEEKRYTDLIESLPKDQARFIFYDFDFVAQNDASNSKILHIMWAPSQAHIKAKMVSASTWNTIKSALGVTSDALEADGLEDIDIKQALDKLKAKSAQ